MAWNGTGSGWFKGPRTLPLILALLSSKTLTGGRDVSRVYLELLAHHTDGGARLTGWGQEFRLDVGDSKGCQ